MVRIHWRRSVTNSIMTTKRLGAIVAEKMYMYIHVYVMTTVSRRQFNPVSTVFIVICSAGVCSNCDTCLQTLLGMVWWLINRHNSNWCSCQSFVCDVIYRHRSVMAVPLPVETVRFYWHASRPDFVSTGMPIDPTCVHVTALCWVVRLDFSVSLASGFVVIR